MSFRNNQARFGEFSDHVRTANHPGALGGMSPAMEAGLHVCAVCGVPCLPTIQDLIYAFMATEGRTRLSTSLIMGTHEYRVWHEGNSMSSSRRLRARDEQNIKVLQAHRLEVDNHGHIAEIVRDHGTSVGRTDRTINTTMEPFPIPVHIDCLTVAKVTVDYLSQFDGHTQHCPADSRAYTLSDLYEIWSERAKATTRVTAIQPNGHPILKNPIREPRNYLLSANFKSLDEWYTLESVRPQLVEALRTSPLNFHNIIGMLSAHLELVPRSEKTSVQDLPEATIDEEREMSARFGRVWLSFDPSARPPTTSCTPRQFSLKSWKKMLFRGHLIPWLFAIDFAKAATTTNNNNNNNNNNDGDRSLEASLGRHLNMKLRDPYVPADGELTQYLDWEKLARKLGRPQVLDDDNGTVARHLTTADLNVLRQRRRIAQLIGTARMGDV